MLLMLLLLMLLLMLETISSEIVLVYLWSNNVQLKRYQLTTQLIKKILLFYSSGEFEVFIRKITLIMIILLVGE